MAPSVVEKLSMLRAFVGETTFSETDLATCLRQSGYLVELAAERLVTVLEEAGCARLREHTKGVPIEAWLAKLDASRPAFLAMLQGEFAVTKLAERQAIANKLGKARREGRA